LATIDDERFTPELSQFNIKCNLDPLELHGNYFSQMHQQANKLVTKARATAKEYHADVVLGGKLLATLSDE
jgi:hypothetical protein